MKRVAALFCSSLPLLACDVILPKESVNINIVEPCDQESMREVTTMEITSDDGNGGVQTNKSSRDKGTLNLGGVSIKDGTSVFTTGYNDTSAAPIAVGATVPLPLKTHHDGKIIPPARTYPDTGTINVPIGKVFSFASTSDKSKSCTSMVLARHGHTASFVPSVGKVLIIGGLTYASDGAETFVPRELIDGTHPLVELYDPSTGAYSPVSIPPDKEPLMQRAFHTATELPNGKILVWGGIGLEGNGTKVSPRAFSFIISVSPTGEVSIKTLASGDGFQIKRFHHEATLLKSGGFVVFTGGCGCVGQMSTPQVLSGQCPKPADNCTDGQARVAPVDVYDVNTDTISTLATGVLSQARSHHSAVAMTDPQHGGDMLVIAGGNDGTSPVDKVEVLLRVGGGAIKFQPPPLETLDVARVTNAAAVTLPNADCAKLVTGTSTPRQESECVLITGGCLSIPGDQGCPQTDVKTGTTIIDYGLPAGSRRIDGPALLRPRYDHQAFTLANGDNMTLLVGGRFALDNGVSGNADTPPVAAEMLERTGNPGMRPFRGVVFMKNPRKRFAATRFPSGQILITGGESTASATPSKASLNSGELFFFPFRPVQ